MESSFSQCWYGKVLTSLSNFARLAPSEARDLGNGGQFHEIGHGFPVDANWETPVPPEQRLASRSVANPRAVS